MQESFPFSNSCQCLLFIVFLIIAILIYVKWCLIVVLIFNSWVSFHVLVGHLYVFFGARYIKILSPIFNQAVTYFLWYWVLVAVYRILCCSARASLYWWHTGSRVYSRSSCGLCVPCDMWGLSFLTRNWTHVPCIWGGFLTTGSPRKSQAVCFLMLSCVSSFYFLDINPLSEISFVSISSHSVGGLYVLLIAFFSAQKSF